MNQSPGYGVGIIGGITTIIGVFLTMLDNIYKATISCQISQLAIDAITPEEAKQAIPTNVQVIAHVMLPPTPILTSMPLTATNPPIQVNTPNLHPLQVHLPIVLHRYRQIRLFQP